MMGGVCYQRAKERGLWFEIKCLEDNIRDKEALGEDASFEKKILRSYRKFTEAQYTEQFRQSREVNEKGLEDKN